MSQETRDALAELRGALLAVEIAWKKTRVAGDALLDRIAGLVRIDGIGEDGGDDARK